MKNASTKSLANSTRKLISTHASPVTPSPLEFMKNLNLDPFPNSSSLATMLDIARIDHHGRLIIGVCFGLISPDQEQPASYEHQTRLRSAVYGSIQQHLYMEKNGIIVKKDDKRCCVLAVLSAEDMQQSKAHFISAIQEMVLSRHGARLRIGIGMPTIDADQLSLACQTALWAYRLYFFEQKICIDYMDVKKDYTISFDLYESLLEETYRSVVAKSDHVFDQIIKVLDAIYDLHYGNRHAAVNRCVMFVGELGKKLKDLNPSAANWRAEQESMQELLLHLPTYQAVCHRIVEFYRFLVPLINHHIEKKNVYEIIKIKNYIDQNYMRDISMTELADMMCVSPTYFSTFFKNATGTNFKAYLTNTRMEESLKLVLRTSMKTYEISESVGYNNVRRFVEAFKQTYQISPMEYRKRHQNQIFPIE